MTKRKLSPYFVAFLVPILSLVIFLLGQQSPRGYSFAKDLQRAPLGTLEMAAANRKKNIADLHKAIEIELSDPNRMKYHPLYDHVTKVIATFKAIEARVSQQRIGLGEKSGDKNLNDFSNANASLISIETINLVESCFSEFVSRPERAGLSITDANH